MNPTPHLSYSELLAEYQLKFQQTNKELKWISFARLVSFALIILSIIYLRGFGAALLAPLLIILFATFLFLIKRYIKKEKEKQFYKNLIQINEDELKALKGEFSQFKDGNEFIDIHHSFSFDLDLFGQKSFFQFLNRSSTQRGRKKLASLLSTCEINKNKITKKQEAIEELAKELNWRQHFAAKGKTEDDQNDYDLISRWSSTSFKLRNEKAIRLLIIIFPILTFAIILLNIFAIVPWGIVLIFVLTQWIIYGFSAKTILNFHAQFGNSSKILMKYIEMLNDIESKDFQSEQLKELKQDLYFENQSASTVSRKLMKLINELDYGRNLAVSIVLNSTLLWDIRCIYKLSKWHEQYHQQLDKWFKVIADFDAYSSYANYNFNHANWTIPEPVSDTFVLQAENMGHPLIREEKRIDNDFILKGNGKLAIITGANMAGKSTFLRTMGINLLLAMNGCRVCASQMKFKPISLYTNMRTTDNLMNDESYFYAELLRLQQLLERLRKGEKLFVIIDEMLKGTNSIDKLNGSKELVKQLISLDAVGIIATHDLKLTELQNQFPNSIKNLCFEVLLTNDDLSFDYKLRTGVTQTMNATFLMKKMGIIS